MMAAAIANSFSQQARDSHHLGEEALASSSTDPLLFLTAEQNLPQSKVRLGGHQKLIHSQNPPGNQGKWIGDPAPFRLHHIHKHAFIHNKFGHACLSKETYWVQDAKYLWIRKRVLDWDSGSMGKYPMSLWRPLGHLSINAC